MASLSSVTLAAKPYAAKPYLCHRSSRRKLHPLLRLSFSSSPIPQGLVCHAARKSFPPDKPPSSPEPATLLDEPPAEEYAAQEYARPPLPGDEPDFWEGPGWNIFGFVAEYLWAIGIVVALIGCGVAVRTYNLGATDFKETPVYKEAMKTQFLESPRDSKVFEESPKEAPSVQENPS